MYYKKKKMEKAIKVSRCVNIYECTHVANVCTGVRIF